MKRWLLLLALVMPAGGRQTEFTLYTDPPGEFSVLGSEPNPRGEDALPAYPSGEPMNLEYDERGTVFFRLYYPSKQNARVTARLPVQPDDLLDGEQHYTFSLSRAQWAAVYAQRYGWLVVPVLLLGGVARRRRTENPGGPVTAMPPAGAGFPRRFGRFELRSSLGSGGFGEVFAARDEGGTALAVKLLRPELQQDAAAVKRFFREIQVLTQLNHPHIVHVYDWGEIEGRSFVAMELLEGMPLSGLPRPVNPEQLLSWLPQLGSALDALHGSGLVHRDIKPDNLFLTHSGRIKVMDFGATLSEELTRATQTGQVLGTPSYMAPEQVRGELHPASDQYALGVSLYFLLTGRKPFEGSDPVALAYAHVHQAPPPPQLGPGVDAVLLRMLAKNPLERYSSVGAAMQSLGAALRGPAGEEATIVR